MDNKRAPASLMGDLGASAMLAGACLARLGLLRGGAHRQRCLALFQSAAGTLGSDSMLAAAAGALCIAAMLNASANAALSATVIVVVLVREVAPLLAALLVLVRMGTAVATEIGMTAARGELRTLALLDLGARDYLAVPAIFALGAATMVLTVYLQVAAAAGAVVFGALFMELPMRMLGDALVRALTPGDLLYTCAKSAASGLIVASVSTHFGLRAMHGDSAILPAMLARAFLVALGLLLALNGAAAWLAFGRFSLTLE